ncbi:MAG: precorrin-6y C5,15-methyltransferase (decarboxylating) subunit CbiE [Hyphomicrobiaceae bacterium]
MADDPWLTIVGIGEDGIDGLSPAAWQAVAAAEVVIGAERHLQVMGEIDAECQTWPVPFADGIAKLLALRGRTVVMLASGDPFWYGAGSIIADRLDPGEWRALPAVSVFSLAAARLGWPLQSTTCLGLHAAPLTRIRPFIAMDGRAIVLLRDGSAVAGLVDYLVREKFGATRMHVMEALGGPRERVRAVTCAAFDLTDIAHPVAVGLAFAGNGTVMPQASGRPDGSFEHDGQITKRPMRALTLSTLAPRAGEHLWDIGAGSGSVGIEWLLAHPSCSAEAVEADPTRAAFARANAERLGVDRLRVVEGKAPAVLSELAGRPDAVFVGGGLSDALLNAIWDKVDAGCRIVANAVTLESEALVVDWQARAGGTLQRIQLSEVTSIGTRRGWQASYPIVQWSVSR